jgi:hypothetical protein
VVAYGASVATGVTGPVAGGGIGAGVVVAVSGGAVTPFDVLTDESCGAEQEKISAAPAIAAIAAAVIAPGRRATPLS